MRTCWETCAGTPQSGCPAAPASPGTLCRRRGSRRQSRWWCRGAPGSGARRTAQTGSPPSGRDTKQRLSGQRERQAGRGHAEPAAGTLQPPACWGGLAAQPPPGRGHSCDLGGPRPCLLASLKGQAASYEVWDFPAHLPPAARAQVLRGTFCLAVRAFSLGKALLGTQRARFGACAHLPVLKEQRTAPFWAAWQSQRVLQSSVGHRASPWSWHGAHRASSSVS